MLLYRPLYATISSNTAFRNNHGHNRCMCDLMADKHSQRIKHSSFSKLYTSLVWFDAPDHDESEYGLGVHFWPCFDVVNWKIRFSKRGKKMNFFDFFAFRALSTSSLSLSKRKLFEKVSIPIFLKLNALQTWKVSSKSVSTFVRRVRDPMEIAFYK